MAKILIVDDDEKMRSLYQDILLSEGFDILVAANGEDGLRLAIENRPDLILLDVMMPYKKGGEVSDDLLDNNKTKDIPVIYLTSIITEEEVKAQQGVVSERFIISKSSSRQELMQRIREVLAARGKR
ncbi:MAG: response regulator [Candidatus Omnitrophica bacterium]|nr:response regulator [Candidatus Omnitrophota bacterium]